jgi:hypothetical protein
MENAELSVNGPVDWLPLFVFVPLHAPLATHVPEAVLAFEVHVKIDEPPTGIKDGFAWSRTAHTPPAIAVGVGLAIQLQSVSEVQADAEGTFLFECSTACPSNKKISGMLVMIP